MILKASQRAHGAELAKHLLNEHENDHVTVHEIRGFIADTLAEALQEAYAMSLGTRCQQYLFSLSLNPPDYADVPIEDFEAAIEETERKLNLTEWCSMKNTGGGIAMWSGHALIPKNWWP